MNRLTEHREAPLVMSMWGGSSEALRIYNRLAAYENTGLEPEEIRVLQEEHEFYNKEDVPTSQRLIELAIADKEGRCVVLPCKEGDTLMLDAEVMGCRIGRMPYTVKGISLELLGQHNSA